MTSKTNLYLWESRIKSTIAQRKKFEKSVGSDIRRWMSIVKKLKTTNHRKFVRLKGRRRLCKLVTPLP